ncbi:hypothetical protein [Aromatoleum evansii]|uniref:hypothetical protein n=1 Tax=Aromatoleum evansii TaxID=59406 RepID=UPI00145EA207|nr:hypothetical protein [Aromatoleum evansii]NMG27825.1 hypothetical protein [Aromatoleum evansii]
MTTTHHTCPHCHSPIALDRFEYATDGEHFFRICPECDHTLLMVDGEDWPVRVEPVGIDARGSAAAPRARNSVDA